jgi:hypothetical protein
VWKKLIVVCVLAVVLGVAVGVAWRMYRYQDANETFRLAIPTNLPIDQR